MLAFGANLEAELFQLQYELRSLTYSPGPYRQFTIREPKPRLVSAAPFRDRVVHHALIAVIAEPWSATSCPPATPTARATAPTVPCAAFTAPAASMPGCCRQTSGCTSPPSITASCLPSWNV